MSGGRHGVHGRSTRLRCGRASMAMRVAWLRGGWRSLGLMEGRVRRGTHLASLIWPTGAASADGVTFMKASSRRSSPLRLAPGKNLICDIGWWRPSAIVTFLEAPSWRPGFVVGRPALCILPWVCVLCGGGVCLYPFRGCMR